MQTQTNESTSLTTKMTVKIYAPLMKQFKQQMKSLHLMRDPFLDSMIRNETPNLASDLAGKRQSPAARVYIARALKRMGTHPVNLVVRKDTVDELNKVVEATNMVRDAFINRLIMFLRGSDHLLDYLELPKMITRSEFEGVVVEAMPTSPLKAIEAVHADPLYYLRVAIEQRHKTGLYLLVMPQQLIGFSCYLDDAFVPGTQSYADKQREADEWLRELEGFEKEVFSTPSPKDSSK